MGESIEEFSRAFTGKTCRVVRNDWTQHYEEHPDELQPFPAQAFASSQAGVNHLGAPEGTVRTRVFHAKKKLRDEMERGGFR